MSARGYEDLVHDIADGAITRERACESKKAYRTPDYAEKVAKAMTKKFGRRQVVVFCPFCECYHLVTERDS